ncbi:MAG: transposase [Phycisphaerae bacterium]|nr:transposase [Phycisphaerae bacterium]
MSHYRRARQPGGVFFFTVVTFDRRPLFSSQDCRILLREAIEATCRDRPFRTVASVLLPDHLHAIWTLPHGDEDFSTRWRLIKTRFTQALGDRGDDIAHPNPLRRRRGRHGVWQSRFWEHLIRDEDDLRCHIDYIHWNPVKHGHVRRVRDWPWSTFHRYAARGIYPKDWGSDEPGIPAEVGE